MEQEQKACTVVAAPSTCQLVEVDVRREQCTVVAYGTPCNVQVDHVGVVITVWADGVDSPHAALVLPWSAIVAQAVAL